MSDCNNNCIPILPTYQVLGLPTNPAKNTIYFVKNGNKVSMYVTDSAGSLFLINDNVNPPQHNELEGLQGGSSGQYYHLTQEEYNSVIEIIGDQQTKLVSIGNIIQNEDAVTLQNVIWLVDGIDFQVDGQLFNITPATDNFYRTDIIVGDNTGTLSIVEGTESETNPVTPSVPVNSVLVTAINVFGDSVYIPPVIQIPTLQEVMEAGRTAYLEGGIPISILHGNGTDIAGLNIDVNGTTAFGGVQTEVFGESINLAVTDGLTVPTVNTAKNITTTVNGVEADTQGSINITGSDIGITNTSDLINDGDGVSPFATEQYIDNLELATTSYVNAAAVVRMNSSTGQWEFVEDSGHQTIYLSSIENLETTGFTSYNFRINYPDVNNIGTLIFSPDEGYAAVDLKAGGSVGLTSANIRVTRSGMAVSFSCNSGVWSMDTDALAVVMPSDFTFSFNTSTGNLSVIHLPLIFNYGDKVIVQMNNNLYTVEYVSKANASFVVRFRDSSGNIVLTPNDDLDFTVYRTGTFRVPNANIQNIPSSGTNFWVQGIFAKTGVSGNVPFDYPIDTYPVNGSDDLITSGGVYNYVQAEKQDFQEVTTEGNTTTNNVTFQGSVDLHNPSGTAGNGSILRFRSGGSATPEAMIVHELISGTQANLNFRVRTSSSAGDAGLSTILILKGGASAFIDVLYPLRATQFKLSALNTAPASATDTGTTGEIRITSDYIYVCIATDTWVRSALATW